MTNLYAERAYEVIALAVEQQILLALEVLRAVLAEEMIGASCVMGLESIPVLEEL